MLKVLHDLLKFDNFLNYLKDGKLSVFQLEYGPGYAKNKIENDKGVERDKAEEVLNNPQYTFFRIRLKLNKEKGDMQHSTEVFIEYNTKDKEARFYIYASGDKKKTKEDDVAEESAAENLEKLLTK